MTEDARECRRVQQDLLLFLDGDLPERDAGDIRDHLAGCAACQAESDAIATVWQAEALRVEPPPDLWVRLQPRMKAGLYVRTRWPRWWRDLRWATVPAFRVAGLIAAVWMGTVIGDIAPAPDPGREAAQTFNRMFYLDAFDTLPPGPIGQTYGEAVAGS